MSKDTNTGHSIISRRPGEKFTIGNDVTVEIKEIRGGQVRVGITAPKELSIRRDNIASIPSPTGK